MDAVPARHQRLVAEIDGWLDLRCPERALERLDPLLADPQARNVALSLRIRAYVAQKRHQEALADIAALRSHAFDPEWLDLTEAWCQKRLRNLPRSVECMEALVDRNPKSAIGHFNLGCYLALLAEPERALDEVSVACGLDESFREMLHDEPDLDCLRNDPRFAALSTPGAEPIDEAEAAAEADAFAEDMAEGFEEDLDDEDFDDADFDDEDEDDGDDASGR